MHCRVEVAMVQFDLKLAQYGKQTVRVYKTMRNAETGVHDVCEMTLNVYLEGEIEASYVRRRRFKHGANRADGWI